jgi:hypothetical protein
MYIVPLKIEHVDPALAPGTRMPDLATQEVMLTSLNQQRQPTTVNLKLSALLFGDGVQATFYFPTWAIVIWWAQQ